MPDAWLRKLVLALMVSALVAVVVRALRGDPAPQFAGPHEVDGGVRPVVVQAVVATPVPSDDSATWAEPIDGDCPPGFPVKAKVTSGIFHVGGGASYDRTRPDRCYRTPAAAEAHGLRAARR
jgi:hypothetical protein